VLEVAKMIDVKTYDKVISMNQQADQPIDEAEFKRFMAPIITKILKAVKAQDKLQ